MLRTPYVSLPRASCRLGFGLTLLLVGVSIGNGQEPDRGRPTPTHANVSYGPHERNVLDY